MAKKQLFESPVIKMYLEPEIPGLYVVWNGTPTAEQFIDAMKKETELLPGHKLTLMYVDMTNLGPVPKKAQDWMINEGGWTAFKNTGIKKIGITIAASALAQMTVENITEESQGVTTKYFSKESEAISWLQSK
jgi:hypothetical protein